MLADILYGIILFLVKTYLRITHDIRHYGLENIPKSGPAVFVANHTSIIDGFIIGCYLPRKIHYIGKSTEFQTPAKRFFFFLSRTFPVRRYDTDPIALRNGFRVLRDGELMGIFPEGERTWDGEMLPLRRGVVRFLLSAGVPIVPAAVSGAFENQPRWGGIIERLPMILRVGEPIIVSQKRGKDQQESDIVSLQNRLETDIKKLIKSDI